MLVVRPGLHPKEIKEGALLTVVTAHEVALEPEMLHRRRDVLGHLGFGILGVVVWVFFWCCRLRTVPVAADVDGDDCVLL